VNDLPRDRDEAAMDPAQRAKIQNELIAARDRQAAATAKEAGKEGGKDAGTGKETAKGSATGTSSATATDSGAKSK